MANVDLVKLLKENNNLLIAEWLAENADQGRREIFKTTIIPGFNEIANPHGLRFEEGLSDSQYAYFCFYKDPSWMYSIKFEFSKCNYQELVCGIYVDNGPDSELSQRKKDRLFSLQTKKTGYYWPYQEDFNENYQNWNAKILSEFQTNPQNFLNCVKDVVSRMCKKLSSVGML